MYKELYVVTTEDRPRFYQFHEGGYALKESAEGATRFHFKKDARDTAKARGLSTWRYWPVGL